MKRDGVAGALFGAATVFTAAGVIGGSWPTGWAAVVCALVCAALGATLLAARRGRRTAPEVRDAAPLPGSGTNDTDTRAPRTGPDKTDAEPRTAAPGRASIVAAAAVWTLALIAAGVWVDDDADDTAATGKAPAKPAPTASRLDDRPAVAWSVPAVGQVGDDAIGFWGLGSTVAQGRIDGLFAYDGADGRVRWSVPAPTREALCAMTPDTEEGVGLVAYGRHDKPCATVLAVRASDGKVLWKKNLGGDGLVEGTLAVGGTTAVGAEDRTVRARDTESGEQRWQRPVPEGCETLAVDADATRTLLVEQCGKGARLLALDTRTGARRWTRDLPVESKATAAVVSVSPVVVAVNEADTRGTQAFLGFDDAGAPTVSVPLSGPDGVLSAPQGVTHDDALRPVVRDGLLVTLAQQESLVADNVVAYSLKDGRKTWSYHAEHQTMALAAESDGRFAVLENENGGSIALLDPATGKATARLVPDTAKPVALSIYPELVPVPGGHVVLNQILMRAEPAAFALR
ncbi:PQQ-binding-like beta-propeller repeat protein [Streptomyces sp. NPDC056361]|uniref:outer membrane protein assembly factor BamB family protein n=1 Tax=Streptomyces sp. NPDC056361 TaxID=3345795 RepID=UPI0035D599B6